MTIFIIEDDKAWSSALRVMLKREGLDNITEFERGEAALEALHQKPDCIFLDFSLKGLNGLDTLKRIKRELPKTRVFIITNLVDEEVKTKCMKAGATLYFTKEEIGNVLPSKLKKKMKRGFFG